MTSNGDQSQPAGSEDMATEPASEGSATEAPRAWLTRLKINRFRHVKAGTELRFDAGINVLLGRNGTGKTTLLELIVAVVKGDLRVYQRESFELEFEILLRGESIVVFAQNEVAQRKGLAGLIGNDSQNTLWSYRIQYSNHDGTSYNIEATRGNTLLTSPGSIEASSFQEASLFTPAFYDNCIRLVLALDQTDFTGFRLQSHRLATSLLRLDEGLDVFRAITEGLPLTSTGIPVRLSLFSGFPWGNPEEPARWLLEILMHYVPASILEHLLRIGEVAHTATEISVSSPDWDFLNTFQVLTDVSKIQISFQLTERTTPEQREVHSIFGKPVFRITTHRGNTFTHDQLSYGEKRLLAFMYHAAVNSDILVADELVNGLHHEWIQACLDAIQGQAFLTSQNPLLLDHLPFSSADEVKRRFILCDRDEHGDWIWRNMDQDSADAFYRAYDVGIQHVSEILETKGLW